MIGISVPLDQSTLKRPGFLSLLHLHYVSSCSIYSKTRALMQSPPMFPKIGCVYILSNTKASFSVQHGSGRQINRDGLSSKVKDLFNASDALNFVKVNGGLWRLWIPPYRYYTFILLLRQEKPKFLLNSSHTLIELLLQWIIWVSKEQILTNEEIMEPWGINYFHNEGGFRIGAAPCVSSCRDFSRVNGLWDLYIISASLARCFIMWNVMRGSVTCSEKPSSVSASVGASKVNFYTKINKWINSGYLLPRIAGSLK